MHNKSETVFTQEQGGGRKASTNVGKYSGQTIHSVSAAVAQMKIFSDMAYQVSTVH